MNEASWEQEFDEQFLHGMKIVISEPYQEMALESTVANEIKQFISKTLSLHDKKLGEYLRHKENCILSQYEGGRVTEDGYEQQFAGKWYEIRPVDRTPKCDCGLVELLAAQVIEGKE